MVEGGGVKTEIRLKTPMVNHLSNPYMEAEVNQKTGKTSIDAQTTGGIYTYRHFFIVVFGLWEP